MLDQAVLKRDEPSEEPEGNGGVEQATPPVLADEIKAAGGLWELFFWDVSELFEESEEVIGNESDVSHEQS